MDMNRIGSSPDKCPDEETIRGLWEQYHTPNNVIAHCRAVAEKAMSLTRQLRENGYRLNEKLIYSAAMLHDIARAEPDHTALGARRVAQEGYEKAAEVIACHHDLKEDENDPVTEKTVVFLADKLLIGDREATLEERFAQSAAKCVTPEAKAAHKRKYDQALSAYSRVLRLIGEKI